MDKRFKILISTYLFLRFVAIEVLFILPYFNYVYALFQSCLYQSPFEYRLLMELCISEEVDKTRQWQFPEI